MAHPKRERIIDRTFRLECYSCDGQRYAELGGEKLERSEAGEPVELYCGRCEADRRFEVIAP